MPLEKLPPQERRKKKKDKIEFRLVVGSSIDF